MATIKYHNVRDAFGRFASKASTKLKTKKVTGLATPVAGGYLTIPKSKRSTMRVVKKVNRTPKTIYNILVLDDSGSMVGAKAVAARESYNKLLRELRKTSLSVKKSNTHILTSLWLFSGVRDIKMVTPFREPMLSPLLSEDGKGASIEYPYFRGSTALASTICAVTADMQRHLSTTYGRAVKVGKDCDIVITVFTDGEENDSYPADRIRLPELMKEKQTLGWTYNLIGLGNKNVVEQMGMRSGFHASNVLAGAQGAQGVINTISTYTTSLDNKIRSYSRKGTTDNVGFFSED